MKETTIFLPFFKYSTLMYSRTYYIYYGVGVEGSLQYQPYQPQLIIHCAVCVPDQERQQK